MPFSDYLPQKAPPWMRTATWAQWWTAIGTSLDAVATRAKYAVKARFAGVAPDDAVKAIAGERGMPPGSPYSGGLSVESTTSLRERIAAAWDRWAYAGNALGLLNALWDLGYQGAKVAIVRGKLYSLDGDRNFVVEALPSIGLGSWLVDSDRSFWSKFDVVFWFGSGFPDVPEAPSDWSGGLPAEDSDEVKALKATIRRWKPAMGHARIVIVTAGRCFGYPTGLTFGTLAGNGYGFSGNSVTVWSV